MSYKDFEVPPRKVVEFTKSKLAKEDSVAKEQINIRVSSRGQTAAKEAAAPARGGGAEEGGQRRILDPQEVVDGNPGIGPGGPQRPARSPLRVHTG